MSKRKKYFVHHLSERSYKPSPESKYTVQVLDSSGRSRAEGYFGDDESSLVVEGEVIPTAVLAAARRQPFGKGDNVNADGESVPAF